MIPPPCVAACLPAHTAAAPAGLLEALQSESPRSDGDSTPSPTAKAGEDEYVPPAEATLLADGEIAAACRSSLQRKSSRCSCSK
jgi:hypothetical protein